jgi:hypothetical protein
MSKHLWLIRYPFTKSRHHGLGRTPINDRRAIDVPRLNLGKNSKKSMGYSVFRVRIIDVMGLEVQIINRCV